MCWNRKINKWKLTLGAPRRTFHVYSKHLTRFQEREGKYIFVLALLLIYFNMCSSIYSYFPFFHASFIMHTFLPSEKNSMALIFFSHIKIFAYASSFESSFFSFPFLLRKDFSKSYGEASLMWNHETWSYSMT